METTVSIKGSQRRVPSLEVDGHTLVVAGRWLRTATIRDEEWQPKPVEDPERIAARLRTATRADLFTFAQKLGDSKPRFLYPLEWDNLAVVPITTFEDWWENRIPQETRKNVRRAAKRGVVIRTQPLDSAMSAGIKAIYDESPVRQGRRFWHYGKTIEQVTRENATYADRCDFICAYLGDELIGFLKTVYTGGVGSIMQILSKAAHQDKRPTNALLAKAIELCVDRGASYFVYGQYFYGRNAAAPLVEFKRRNGFEQMLVPRYYLPLTAKGDFALRCQAHRGWREFLPEPVETALLRWRSRAASAWAN